MDSELDHGSPVPLYHQISEAIRYRIATGDLAAEARLPAVRDAAAAWRVNVHTVRHAYQALERQGLVEIRGPRGTLVRAGRASEARAAGIDIGKGRAGQRVAVVECSTTQAVDLAEQLESRYDVVAQPWSLEGPGELPAGQTVATTFHYNDIRTRWPGRLQQVDFVSIRPDPELAGRVRDLFAPVGTAYVCEREETFARLIAADLSATVGPEGVGFELQARVEEDAAAFYAAGDPAPRLLAPRVWGQLTPAQRADPRALEVRYVFDLVELDSIARRRSWPRRRPVPTPAGAEAPGR